MTEIAAVVKRRRRPYPAYRDSGVDWLGQVPEHWEVRRLKYAAPIRNSKLGEKPESATYIGLEHIESWTGRLLTEEQPDGVESVVAEFAASDVLFGKLRPYLAKVVRPEFDGVCSTEILPLQPGSEIRQEFLFYYLLNRDFVRWVDSLTYGTKMPRVSPEQISSAYVAVPPLPEQRAIATFLDRETARIDELVAKKERLIALLQEKRAALITRAVTKGLDPNAPMKDSGVEWLGEVPEHWEVRPLWHLTPQDRPIMYGIVLPGPNVEEGVPIVKGGDVDPERLRLDRLNRTTPEIEARYTRSRLRGGDVVYAIRGSIGAVAIVPEELTCANLTQDAARVSYTDRTYGRWLLHVLGSSPVFGQLESGALGATIRGINIRDLKRATLPVPPYEEQIQIGDYVDHESELLAELVGMVRIAIARLQEYRTGLISAAVTGKINVR